MIAFVFASLASADFKLVCNNGPFLAATTSMAFATLDFCQREAYDFVVNPKAYSPYVTFPLLVYKGANISESIAIANFVGTAKCPKYPLASDEQFMKAMMWSNKLNNLWGKGQAMVVQTIFSGTFELAGKEAYWNAHLKKGTSTFVPEGASGTLSGGDHIELFANELTTSHFLLGDKPTYIDAIFVTAWLHKQIVPLYGMALFKEYPVLLEYVKRFLSLDQDMFKNIDKFPLLPANFFPPLDAVPYPAKTAQNFKNFHQGVPVIVLIADETQCPLFFGEKCRDSAKALNKAWDGFLEQERKKNPMVQAIRAGPDVCGCDVCENCNLVNSCDSKYRPQIRVYDPSKGMLRSPPWILMYEQFEWDTTKWKTFYDL